MYSGVGQVFKKKSNRSGVIFESDNYVLYEDVDEIDRYRKIGYKKPEPKPKVQPYTQPYPKLKAQPQPRYKPAKENLDNYRYYEDMRIREQRHKDEVKHRRKSKPKGKETPFNKDSFKRYDYYSPNPPKRSYSNERKIKSPNYLTKNPLLKSPKQIYHATKPSLKSPKQINKTKYTTIKSPKNVYHAKKPSLKSPKKLNYTNYPSKYQTQTFTPRKNETFIYEDLHKCPKCGGDLEQKPFKDKREKTYITGQKTSIRKLKVSPKSSGFRGTYTVQNKLRTVRNESNNKEFEDPDFNYQYKESVYIRRPKRNDSKTYHVRRAERSYSGEHNHKSFEKGLDNNYRNFYSPSNRYKKK